MISWFTLILEPRRGIKGDSLGLKLLLMILDWHLARTLSLSTTRYDFNLLKPPSKLGIKFVVLFFYLYLLPFTEWKLLIFNHVRSLHWKRGKMLIDLSLKCLDQLYVRLCYSHAQKNDYDSNSLYYFLLKTISFRVILFMFIPLGTTRFVLSTKGKSFTWCHLMLSQFPTTNQNQ